MPAGAHGDTYGAQHLPELWCVRHGETEWSRMHRHTGRTDLLLTPAGEEAARGLAPRLAGIDFDLVLTSPLRRARHTAELAGFPHAEPVDDAREWDYGEAEGITTQEVRASRPGWTLWRDGAPGGEDPAAVGARCDRLVARVRVPGVRRALLVAHAHLLRVLTARWLGQRPVDGAHYLLDTATVSVLGWERETPALLRWNA